MIISPPFLPVRNAQASDDSYLDTAMPEQEVGRYPISNKLSWHGGIHLTAPSRGNGREPARAIADGTVVYVRPPTPRPDTAAEREAHALGYNGWTDDGCIVILHSTEIGAHVDGAGVEIRFYSIYVHLSTILSSIQPGQKILRKTELGSAGMFEGIANSLHFEVICDDINLKRMIGRDIGTIDIQKNGRTDVVFGEMYFRLPAGTTVYSERPALNQTHGLNGVELTEELFIGIKYHRGDLQTNSYRSDGTTLPPLPTESGAEYNIYRDADRIVQSYRNAHAATVPAHSATYELLRYGRIIGPDALTPEHTPHWRRISTTTGPFWANLNATDTCKFSDGDAPHWAGWHLVEDSTGGDSRCSVSTLRRLLDSNGDGINTEAESERRLNQETIKKFLRRLICKVPTEWHRASVASRWAWLKVEGPGDARHANSLTSGTYLTEATFPAFQRYAEALCFWEEANMDFPSSHWHFHPKEFIRLHRQNGWLSDSEFKEIYPERRTPKSTRDTYRTALNLVARKYMYSQTPVRLAHFLGQGAIESEWMQNMQEKSMIGRLEGNNLFGTRLNPASSILESQLGHWYGAAAGEEDAWYRSNKYNSRGGLIASSYNWRNGNLGDPHAQQFRGRGFKQLTGLINYSLYWVYRGWLNESSFDDRWWTDTQYIARNPTRMRARPPVVDDPQRATSTPFNCMDTGGWYLVGMRPSVMRLIDDDNPLSAPTHADLVAERALSFSVTEAINGGRIQADDRLRETRNAKSILL